MAARRQYAHSTRRPVAVTTVQYEEVHRFLCERGVDPTAGLIGALLSEVHQTYMDVRGVDPTADLSCALLIEVLQVLAVHDNPPQRGKVAATLAQYIEVSQLLAHIEPTADQVRTLLRTALEVLGVLNIEPTAGQIRKLFTCALESLETGGMEPTADLISAYLNLSEVLDVRTSIPGMTAVSPARREELPRDIDLAAAASVATHVPAGVRVSSARAIESILGKSSMVARTAVRMIRRSRQNMLMRPSLVMHIHSWLVCGLTHDTWSHMFDARQTCEGAMRGLNARWRRDGIIVVDGDYPVFNTAVGAVVGLILSLGCGQYRKRAMRQAMATLTESEWTKVIALVDPKVALDHAAKVLQVLCAPDAVVTAQGVAEKVIYSRQVVGQTLVESIELLQHSYGGKAALERVGRALCPRCRLCPDGHTLSPLSPSKQTVEVMNAWHNTLNLDGVFKSEGENIGNGCMMGVLIAQFVSSGTPAETHVFLACSGASLDTRFHPEQLGLQTYSRFVKGYFLLDLLPTLKAVWLVMGRSSFSSSRCEMSSPQAKARADVAVLLQAQTQTAPSSPTTFVPHAHPDPWRQGTFRAPGKCAAPKLLTAAFQQAREAGVRISKASMLERWWQRPSTPGSDSNPYFAQALAPSCDTCCWLLPQLLCDLADPRVKQRWRAPESILRSTLQFWQKVPQRDRRFYLGYLDAFLLSLELGDKQVWKSPDKFVKQSDCDEGLCVQQILKVAF